MNPIADKESPCECDDGSRGSDSDEAVSRNRAIRLDQIIEAHRGRLHEPKGDHANTKLEPDPTSWRRVVANEAEYQRPSSRNEQCRKGSDETGLWFRKAM